MLGDQRLDDASNNSCQQLLIQTRPSAFADDVGADRLVEIGDEILVRVRVVGDPPDAVGDVAERYGGLLARMPSMSLSVIVMVFLLWLILSLMLGPPSSWSAITRSSLS